MMNNSTDTLIQNALNGTDLFATEPQIVGSTDAGHGLCEVARLHIQNLLSSLAPELRRAISSSFGLEGEEAEAGHLELIGRALSQLRLEPASGEVAKLAEPREVQAA